MSAVGLLSIQFLVVVCAASAQTAPTSPSPTVPPGDENPARADDRIDLRRVIDDFDPIRQEVEKRITRVRIYHRAETLFADGRVAASTEIDMPPTTGIVIDALPIIMISATHLADYIGAKRVGAPDIAKERPTVSSKYVRMVGPLYEAILPGERRVSLTVKERSRPLNVLFLELEGAHDPPPELRHVLELGSSPRRFAEREVMGGIAFKNATASAVTTVVPTVIRLGGGQFTRPASHSLSGTHVGTPLLSSTGEWLGIVNMQPPELGIVEPRIGPKATGGATIDRDPTEWSSGYLNPVLMSATELAPEITRVRESLTTPHDFPEFGVTLRDRSGRVELDRCDAERFSSNPPAQPGDIVERLGDAPIPTVRAFERLMESLLNASTERPRGVLVRGDQRIPFEIVVP